MEVPIITIPMDGQRVTIVLLSEFCVAIPENPIATEISPSKHLIMLKSVGTPI